MVMDEEQSKIITEEVNQIIHSRFEFINKHYLSIREAYKNQYDWPELDPIRHEICICIMFGLCQAAITLTNHLLESLLKYALIISHGKDKKQKEEKIKGRVVSAFVEKYKEGIKLYDDANLEKTINRACTVGLISKEQKNKRINYTNLEKDFVMLTAILTNQRRLVIAQCLLLVLNWKTEKLNQMKKKNQRFRNF